MGSLRALVLVGALMGCDASGLQVNVVLPDSGPAPDHIRLFVGLPKEDKVMIGPAGFDEARAGSSWVRDPMDFDDLIEVKPGAELSFGFLSDVDHAELGAIIAIGYTGTKPTSAGSLFHVRTGVGVVHEFTLQLFPIDDDLVQVEIWGPNEGDEACVHLWNQHPNRDMTDPHDSAFIVSRNNRDCDQWLDDDALECSADIHEANAAPRPEDFNCATIDDSMATGGTHCVLGGPACIDGELPDGQCTPSTYCAPHALCELCTQRPDATARRDCIRAAYAVPNPNLSLFGVKCHIGTLSQTPGRSMLCPDAPTVLLPIPATMPPLACSNAMVGRVGQPLGSAITHDNAGLAVAVDAGCALTLTPTGEVGLLNDTFIVHGIVTVDLDNGRSLALPLQVHLDPTCDGANYCQFLGDNADAPRSCLLAGSAI